MQEKENELIVFTNLQRGYSTTDKIAAGLEYKNFIPDHNDWIVVVPAGSPKFSLFCALKGAPVPSPKASDTKDESQCSNEIDEEVDELFPLMPIFRKQKTIDKKTILSKPDKKESIAEVVFDPEESKLAPNNFYQLAYVQKSTREILAVSSVFYVEPKKSQNSHDPNSRVDIHTSKPIPEDVIKSQPKATSPMTREATAILTHKRHGWRSFFCGSSSGDQWSESLTSYVLPTAREVDEEDSEEDYFPESTSERKRLISSDDGFEEEKEKEKPRKSPSSLAQFLLDLWRQPFSAPSGNYSLYIGEAERRSASMYEIGTTGYSGNPTTEPYQKMVCQLTHSNNNLLHENERLHRRVQQLEMTLREQMDQMNSIYYTLFRNGVSSIRYPDGEEVHLSQFRGQLVDFVKANENAQRVPLKKVNGMSDFASVIRERRMLDRTSDLSSESSISSGSVDQDELKAAMLKCITKSKYNDDLDDFVNWLNDSGVQSARFEGERKSRSLEEHMQESLRIRQPLQRSPRVDRARSESELLEGSSPDQPTSSKNGIQQQESFNRQVNNGSNKTKALRMRAQSVAGAKANTIFGTRRTSSVVRQSMESRSNGQRKSLANLASLRTSANRQPRRNLI